MTKAYDHFSSGVPFSAQGKVTVSADSAVLLLGRWPMTANGAVAVEFGPVDHVQNGIPFTKHGRVAIR